MSDDYPNPVVIHDGDLETIAEAARLAGKVVTMTPDEVARLDAALDRARADADSSLAMFAQVEADRKASEDAKAAKGDPIGHAQPCSAFQGPTIPILRVRAPLGSIRRSNTS